jgi:DNA glycosylase AlkZ-like
LPVAAQPKPPARANLTWPQVHAFRLERHHLQDRASARDLARVVGEIGGAQAQVMSAAELQVAVRVDCQVGDVRDALWKDRALVKTWLMRGTLHLARAEDLPLYSAAMRGRWMRMRPSYLKFMQITESEFWKLEEEIGAALDGRPLTREELIARVGKGKSPRIHELLRSGWGGILKPAARSGLLCFGPSRGQSVTFVSPRAWLRGWRALDPDEAIVEAARRYLHAFGPATKTDFAPGGARGRGSPTPRGQAWRRSSLRCPWKAPGWTYSKPTWMRSAGRGSSGESSCCLPSTPTSSATRLAATSSPAPLPHGSAEPPDGSRPSYSSTGEWPERGLTRSPARRFA